MALLAHDSDYHLLYRSFVLSRYSHCLFTEREMWRGDKRRVECLRPRALGKITRLLFRFRSAVQCSDITENCREKAERTVRSNQDDCLSWMRPNVEITALMCQL